MQNKEVYIIGGKRTPSGGFLGSLSQLSAVELGAIAIKETIKTTEINKDDIDEVIIGNVLSANLGQSPARQAALLAGIPDFIDATTINKVCSSGIKSISYGAQSILLGNSNVILAGGMESMSNTPYYLEKHRSGNKTGNHIMIDGMLKDGLWDPNLDFHMGNAAELANKKYKITRQMQDDYALNSYQLAKEAIESGFFKHEICPVNISTKKEEVIIDSDEDISKLNPNKVPKLKPIFEQDGSITAANASNLNDGAAAVILASSKYVNDNNIRSKAKIIDFADAAQEPQWFTTSPSLAIKKVLHQTGISVTEIDYFEINEAYANVPIINSRILGLDTEKVNVNGGAIAIGHPLGVSGTRIILTLMNILIAKNAKYGIAAICNGGGGATAMLIENVEVK